MDWASVVSRERVLSAAVEELTEAITSQLGGEKPNLVLGFVSPDHRDNYEQLPDLIHDRLSPNVFVGCSALGVIGGGEEIEHQVGLSLTAAFLPGVTLHPFHIESNQIPNPDAEPKAWVESLEVSQRPAAHFIILADPYTFDPRDLLMGLDFAYSDGAKVGGLASAPDRNALFLNRDLFSSGAVGVALQGNLKIDTVVAQGCRPIGTPMTITGCQNHYLLEVDGKTPMETLAELYGILPPKDQELVRHSLHIGIASTELQEEFKQGDFLIRNVMGSDQEKGTLVIGDNLRNGQTIQFHVRDADTAAEDIDQMLSRYREKIRGNPPSGALLFSCVGRGEHLYGQSNHDSDAFKRKLGKIPIGGFFCNGEIGPVVQSTHLHGFTSSFGIFRPLEIEGVKRETEP